MQIGVQHFHFAVALDVAGGHFAGTHRFNINGFHALAVDFGHNALDVQDDVRHVLLHTGDGGKFMLDTGNFDAGGSGAGQRREQDAPQRIAQGRAVAALQRLHDILAVSHIAGSFDALDLRLFDFNHQLPLLLMQRFSRCGVRVNRTY